MITHDTVKPIMQSAGQFALNAFASTSAYGEKARHELVSDVDEVVEQMLISSLRKEFPTYGIYSEESGENEGDGKNRWIIDPIDGTAYFLCGVPYFSICVSLEVEGAIVEAFVLNPISNEFYYACADPAIATLNGKPIRPSSISQISEAKVAVGFSAIKSRIDNYFADWGGIFASCQKGLPLVAPALTICNVARGRLDAFLDSGSSMEGHSGAALILKAAGGAAGNYDLTDWDYRTKGIVATNGLLDLGSTRYPW